MLDENYCPKCNATPAVFQRVVLTVKIKDFEPMAKLFQDNLGCLINITQLETTLSANHFDKFIKIPATFLILKRCKNSVVDYVILDINFVDNKN